MILSFRQVDLPSEDVAKSVAERAICIKGIFEPWGCGATADECWQQVAQYPAERKTPFLQEGSTFKINVMAYGKAIGEKETKQIVETCFDHVEFRGKARSTFLPAPVARRKQTQLTACPCPIRYSWTEPRRA